MFVAIRFRSDLKMSQIAYKIRIFISFFVFVFVLHSNVISSAYCNQSKIWTVVCPLSHSISFHLILTKFAHNVIMCNVVATFDYKLNCIKHLRVMAIDLVITYCNFDNALRKFFLKKWKFPCFNFIHFWTIHR